MANQTFLKIETHIVHINIPSLIDLDIFMEHRMEMDFDNYQFTFTQEEWKMPSHYLSGQAYIRPKMNAKV